MIDVAAGPVSRILSAGVKHPIAGSRPALGTPFSRTVIPLGHALLQGSSDLPGGCDAPSQHVPRANPRLPPYLVLLRVGFALPAALLRRRCALTAPFHPYPSVAARAVCFLWHFPSNDPTLAKATMRHPPGRYPAHCSAEFGLSSPAARRRRERPSGPAANKVIIFDARTSKLGLQTSESDVRLRPRAHLSSDV